MAVVDYLATVPVIGSVLATSLAAQIVLGLSVAIGVILLYLYPYREYTLTFRNVPGPKPTSFLWGSLHEIIKAPPNSLHSKWIDEFGPTVRYRILLGEPRLYSADPVFINHIFQKSYDFIKPERARRTLDKMLGRGVLTAEGDAHKRQRRVLAPAFGPAAIRGMQDIFWDKSYELQRKLLSFLEDENCTEVTAPTPTKPEDQVKGTRKIDVGKYLAQAALDIIGLGGFDYDFGGTQRARRRVPPNVLCHAGHHRSRCAAELFPHFRDYPTTIRLSHLRTVKVARELVDKKKALINAQFSGELEKGSDVGKDLLSQLMKANMAPDLKPEQRISDEEVMAQVTTFMLAGNETSSTALTWGLYRLALMPEVQKKLRDECMAVDEERPSPETLNNLRYLENFVHEVLRFDSPVPGTLREAVKDTVVPLGTPVKGRDGTMVNEITIKAGVQIFIPIMNVNHSKAIWGEDADKFNPDRYDRQGLPGQHVPGVYGNLLTFLGGVHNCVGYRFAVAEIKVMLFVLIRSFEFLELPSKPVIEPKASIVMRPRVVGEEKAGLQMPLLVRPLSSSD